MGDEVTLRTLIDDMPPHDADPVIAGLASDSRMVGKDFIFFALAGSKAHGGTYMRDAIARGASVVVSEEPRPSDIPDHIHYIKVDDARLTLAHAAARFFPRQPETIVAVTGTAGKSSVADFTRQIFSRAGFRSASLGTIGITRDNHIDYGALTTPDPVSLHQTLQNLADEGITHLAMEASSHGLDQKRLDAVKLKAAAFTNLGHDHLDYHRTREAYLAAKMRLFDTLLPSHSTAVVNVDADDADAVKAVAISRGLDLITVGIKGETIRLKEATRDGFDQRLRLSIVGRDYDLRLPLAGTFQVSNALVAAGLALATDISVETILAALSTLNGVRGRLERVGSKAGALIIVDYAHKPDALEQVLQTMRPFVSGRLICVFGCGGDRDKEKRGVMGAIAHRLADIVIVTDDNPRSEDPALIRQSILAASPDAMEIGDRAAAIETAIKMLQEGDVLVIAGKGHETGQIIGSKTLPFSDHDVVATCLQKERA